MEIIIKPILTEKMTVQGEKLNRYGFIVDVRANKLQIRNAVEQMYGVVVTDVNTINYMGKQKAVIRRPVCSKVVLTTSRRRSSP